MSNDRHDERKALAKLPSSAEYDVGYGKPPLDTRFRPGQSGNPRGRPKGSKNRPKPPALHEERLKSIVLEEAYRAISVKDANRQVTIPMAQAVIRSLAVNAAKGNQRAQRLFTELLATTERDNKRLHDEWLETAINYKVEWERELERRRALGIDGPEPLPHPDHVVINMQNGTVEIRGPVTKEDKAEWDRFRTLKKDCDREIAEVEKLLAKPNYRYRDQALKDLAHAKRVRVIITQVVPDEPN